MKKLSKLLTGALIALVLVLTVGSHQKANAATAVENQLTKEEWETVLFGTKTLEKETFVVPGYGVTVNWKYVGEYTEPDGAIVGLKFDELSDDGSAPTHNYCVTYNFESNQLEVFRVSKDAVYGSEDWNMMANGSKVAIEKTPDDIEFADIFEGDKYKEIGIKSLTSSKTKKPAKVTSVKVKDTEAENGYDRDLVVTWKASKGAKGYEVAYRAPEVSDTWMTEYEFKAVKKHTMEVMGGLKFSVKVRAYKIDEQGRRVYGAWSKTVSVKTKSME